MISPHFVKKSKLSVIYNMQEIYSHRNVFYCSELSLSRALLVGKYLERLGPESEVLGSTALRAICCRNKIIIMKKIFVIA